ncbi:MAG TPA: phospholipase D-like domain-containing protein [Alphaproteobacteria bacterium]
MVAALVLFTSCASPPDFWEVANSTPPVTVPRLLGARGPLTEQQSRVILARVRAENPNSNVLERHLAFEEAIADHPLTVGNQVTLLHDGKASFDAIFKAINGAWNHINLEYYTFEDVEHNGQHLVDLLATKQTAGVQVNLIYDSFGSSGTPGEVFDRLRQAGVAVLDFHPLGKAAAAVSYSINDRDHRKILVADGTLGITGGVNLATYYSSTTIGHDERGTPPEYWRDTDLKIEGPAVAELQRLFIEHWERQEDGPMNEADFFPPPPTPDAQIVRIIGSTPQRSVPLFYVTLISAIRNAEERVWITSAYFVPTRQEVRALRDAARRGVDVRLLLPSRSDNSMTVAVSRGHYADLLEAGVKIFELQSAILHSKTATVDGVWSAVGSSNFDGRSVLFNDEVDAIVLGRETAAQLETAFEADRRNSDQIDPVVWKDRSIAEKVREEMFKLWSYWM